jgi:hypothetical protein
MAVRPPSSSRGILRRSMSFGGPGSATEIVVQIDHDFHHDIAPRCSPPPLVLPILAKHVDTIWVCDFIQAYDIPFRQGYASLFVPGLTQGWPAACKRSGSHVASFIDSV